MSPYRDNSYVKPPEEVETMADLPPAEKFPGVHVKVKEMSAVYVSTADGWKVTVELVKGDK